MRKVGIILGFLVLLELLEALPGHARDFRSADVYPTNAPTVQALGYMGTLVNRGTNGRHRILPREASDGGSENYIVGQVRTGNLDMARVNAAVLNAIVPSTAVISAPYVFKSDEALHSVLDGPIGDGILGELESHGMVGLCFYDIGPRSLFTTEKRVRLPEDLRGMRVRSQPGDLAQTIWKALGAEPVSLPYARVSDAMRSRLVDAATDNLVSLVAGERYRFIKYLTPTEHVRTPGILIFSLEVWRKLDEHDRTVIRAAAKESAIRERRLMEAFAVEALRTVRDQGVTIVEDANIEAFRTALVALRPSLLPNFRQQSLLQRIQEAQPNN